MIGKIIGAALGGGIAKQATGMKGTTGAMIGAAVPLIVRRMSIPGMIALGVGGYLFKRHLDKREMPEPENQETAPVASIPQPETLEPQTRPNGAAVIASQPVPAGTA